MEYGERVWRRISAGAGMAGTQRYLRGGQAGGRTRQLRSAKHHRLGPTGPLKSRPRDNLATFRRMPAISDRPCAAVIVAGNANCTIYYCSVGRADSDIPRSITLEGRGFRLGSFTLRVRVRGAGLGCWARPPRAVAFGGGPEPQGCGLLGPPAFAILVVPPALPLPGPQFAVGVQAEVRQSFHRE